MNFLQKYHAKSLTILLFLLIIINYSCSLFNSDEEIDNTEVINNVLLPLQKGNYWLNETSHYTEGKLDSNSSSQTIETIEYIINYSYKGDDYNLAVSSIKHGIYPDNPQKWLYWNGREGLYFFGGISHTDSLIIKKLNYRYPVHVGEKWESNILEYSYSNGTFSERDEIIKIECIDTNYKYITRIDTFNCIKYHFKMRIYDDIALLSDFYYYFSPDVGRISYEIYDDGILKFRSELINYGTIRNNNESIDISKLKESTQKK